MRARSSLSGPYLSRRGFAVAGLAALAAPRALAAPAATAESPVGPFYPAHHRGESDYDLTRLEGHANRARGEVIEVTGRVLDRHGNPLRGARLELWQCNAAGRYAHPNDVATAPLDPDFQGFARLVSDRQGGWRIVTIKPAAYESPIGLRTPHIHWDVQGPAHRLSAQMYFPEDAATNATDALFRGLGAEQATSLANAEAPGRYSWDIVLMDG
jgi:protocatechuate 3,4-dioxygenase, beta subunit